MRVNPYEPPGQIGTRGGYGSRLIEFWNVPFPVRRVEDTSPFGWIFDALIAFVLWISGVFVAGGIAMVSPFLSGLAYPTGLIIGWFPLALWMHYCRVDSESRSSAVMLTLTLMAIFAVQGGVEAFRRLPISLAVLAVALPLEAIVGKLILSNLPGSSARNAAPGRTRRSS